VEVSVDGGDAVEFLYEYLVVGGEVVRSGVEVSRLIRDAPKPKSH
jgi:hypothetical protein